MAVGPVWGVDLGMRAWYAVRIDEATHSTFTCVIKRAKGEERAQTLAALSSELANVVDGETTYLEEPPMAGVRNIRTFKGLAETAGALMARATGRVHYVPVSSWKKDVCGKGNLDKAGVAGWLGQAHPAYLEHCAGDQNLIDATCIALYGVLAELRSGVALAEGD